MNEQLTQAQKLANAISYLRSEGKYIADQDCNFKPTRSDRMPVATALQKSLAT